MSNWKKVLIFVILPSLITGLFSFAPKIFDLITEAKADLSYSVSEGPSLEVDSSWRKVISIEIINSGKISLNNVYSETIINDGIIEYSEVKDNLGLKPELIKTNNSTTVKIHKLHKNENLVIAFMLLLNSPDTKMDINIRSDELRATFMSPDIKSAKNDEKLSWLSALLAGLSVVLMSSGALFSLRKGLFKSLPFYNFKQDLLLYIIYRSGFIEEYNLFANSDNDYTYLRIADIFLIRGLSKTELKEKAVNGLKSMLLIKSISKTSQEIIIDNLKKLEGEKYSEETIAQLIEKSISLDNLLKIRQLIDNTVFSANTMEPKLMDNG